MTYNRKKMSKSLGNTLVVHELLKKHKGEVLRYQLLSAHYRQPLDCSDEALSQCHRTLDRMYAVLRDAADKAGVLEASPQPGSAFIDALHDDLNTPVALAELNTLARKLAGADDPDEIRRLAGELLADGELIGLLQQVPQNWFESGAGEVDDAAIDRLIRERESARADKNFARADEIREQLTGMGIVLEDSAGGTRWRRG